MNKIDLTGNPLETIRFVEAAYDVSYLQPYTYKELAKVIHPDNFVGDPIQPRASAAFAKLSALHAGVPSGDSFVVSTRKRSFAVNRTPLHVGDLANLYPCAWNEDDEEQAGLLKLSRSPKVNPLLAREATALKRLRADGLKQYHAYVPELIETFKQRDRASKVERQASVLRLPDGLYSLEEVHTAYPRGIGGRDVAWMWRRLLVALGFVHQAGLVHGAIVPKHVLIHPAQHGIVLIDWAYSTEIGTPLRARVPEAMLKSDRPWYPIEGLDKTQSATEATDIYMASQCMTYLLGERAPAAMRAFARGCTLPAESARPHNAWDLKEEFDELLERMYGERRFVPFWMPDSVPA